MLQTNNKDLWTSKPIRLASKKKVQGAYRPNSYRIFEDQISDKKVIHVNQKLNLTEKAYSSTNVDKTKISSIYWGEQSESNKNRTGYIANHPREPTRRNCPHPDAAKFIRKNVASLNDAIPIIATDKRENDDKKWWIHDLEYGTVGDTCKLHDKIPKMKIINKEQNTSQTTRQKVSFNMPKVIRKQAPPTSDWILNHTINDKKRFLEHISYRHGTDIRGVDNKEPTRGKLPGSFVWKELRE
jgi:hypothetical protein